MSTTADDRVNVMLVEDEDLFRDLLRISLSQHPRLNVVGAFASGASALEAAEQLNPRVAILDIELRGDINGVQLGLLLRRKLPNLGIVLLSNHKDPQLLAAVPKEAASGWSYLLKRSVTDTAALARAVQGAASGFVVLDSHLVSEMRPDAKGRLSRLTPRQREILALIAQGYTNAAIAQQLVLSEKSVENQTNLLYQHLGVNHHDRTVHPRVRAVITYLQEIQH